MLPRSAFPWRCSCPFRFVSSVLSNAKTHRHPQRSDHRRRPDHHRPGLRVRLFGAQACKALREEGYKVILVNSNPATIMTDPEMADVTYIEPVNWQMVESIIARERPDALLPTMGGQTGLNCALDLARHGVLEKYGVEMIGASREAIDKAEDREKFKQAMKSIGLDCPRSMLAHSWKRRCRCRRRSATRW